jgi:hypothetical protein
MLLLMEGGFSSVEMKVLQSRMKEGRDQAFKAGKYLSGNPPAPYYHDKAEGGLLIDQQQIKVSIASTHHHRHHALADIAGSAQAAGHQVSIIDAVGDDPELAAMAERVAARTREFTSFIVDDLGVDDLGASRAGACTLHHSCHGLRNLGIKDQPEVLLDHVDGLDRSELPGADECCGFGGLFSVEMPSVSIAMLAKKLDAIESTGADVVVGGDVSCLMHIAGGLHRRGSPVAVRHIAEILDGEQS